MRGDLALETELVGVRRQDQFNRSGVEADAMVQTRDPVFRVDTVDGHHGREDLRVGDAAPDRG